MTRPLLIILLLASGALSSWAQDSTWFQNAWPDYQAFQTPARQDSILTKSLNFRMKSTGYFKNNEYKNAFVTGASLIGIYFDPLLEYHPDEKTTIRAGAHLLKYQGEDTFDRKVPVLTLQYDATPHFSLIFGTINGTVNHGLIEPVMDFEKYLTDNYENGLQLLWNYTQFRSDVWLNWEQFLKPGDPFQEHFTAGSNSSILLLETKNFRITTPFSTVFRHKGGETDATNLPASTQLNLVEGLRLSWTFVDNFVKSAALTQNYVEFLEINPGDYVTIPYGHGSYTRAFIDTKIGSFEAGYWKSNNFVSPHGMPVFQSVSQKDPAYLQSFREMLVLKYQFELNLTDYLKFALRIEPYYLYDTHRLDHSWSLYMVFDDEFLIARTKRK